MHSLDDIKIYLPLFFIYAPTSSYDDNDVDEFYRELQPLVDQTPKQDSLVVQCDWNGKVGKDAQEDWGEVCGSFCNLGTNDKYLKLQFIAYLFTF